jgi:hypothetical protein
MGTVLVPHFVFGRKIIWSEAQEPSETSEKVSDSLLRLVF